MVCACVCVTLLSFKKESSEMMVVFVQSHILCVQACTRRSLIVLVSQSCVCGSVAKSKTSLKLVHQVKNTVSFVSVQ